MFARVFLCLLVVKATAASCPGVLQRFSTLYGTDVTKSQTITITDNVLLDVSKLDVDYIEIRRQGCLEFNRGHDITVRTKGIFVKENGSLVIGSEDNRHTDNVLIVLEGRRSVNRSILGEEGEKYIAVQDNGSLQIHGEERRAWTKLSGTVDRFNAGTVHYYHNVMGTPEASETKSGIRLNILDSDLSNPVYASYGLKSNSVRVQTKILLKIATLLSELSNGSVVGFTVANELSIADGVDIEDFFKFIEELVGMEEGELLLRNATQFDSFSFVFVVGEDLYDQSLEQQIGLRHTEARSSIVYKGKKISSVSKITPRRSQDSFVDLRVLDLSVGFPEVTVTHDISSWKAGDKVLFTSTDYAWNHGEVRTIKNITSDRSFTLTHEFDYRHFGEIEDGVDMRAEVALLSRNIKIQGKMQRGCPGENGNCDSATKYYDTYGGHIKVFGFSSVVIQGAELQFMGQTMDRGNYPIHFHMCKDITGKTALIRRNSIHHTYRRAITVHGTFGTSEEQPGVQIIENVAYYVLGHTYFLEDGAEKATILKGNLGAATMHVDNDFRTDASKATTYWITNPKTIMIDNVAAGSEGFGIWYTFPLSPVGQSEGLAYGHDEAKRTALWTVDNNVVHSNLKGGFNFDFILDDEDGTVQACMRYTPSVNPLDEDSKGMEVQINRLTAYKNRDINVWLRGGWFDIYQLSSAESKKGIQLARGGEQQMFVKKSLFIGQSRGNIEYAGYPDAVTPVDLGQYLGIVFHDGPTYFESCWFNGFDSDGSYVAGAIGFAPKKKFHSSIVSSVTDMRFGFVDGVDGNRISDGLTDDSVQGTADFDNDETATFRDTDGSVTSCAGDTKLSGPVQVLKTEASFLTENCTFRENWNMAVCQALYGKLKVGSHTPFSGSSDDFDQSGQMRRRRYNNTGDIFVEDHTNVPVTEYTVLVGSDIFYYEFQYLNEFPKSFRVYGVGIGKHNEVVIGICLPQGATFADIKLGVVRPNDDNFYGADNFLFAESLEELSGDTSMRKLYMDGRMLYIRISSKKVRNEHWDREDTDHCPGEECPLLKVYMLKEFAYTPCFTPTDEQLSNTDVLAATDDLDCLLPSSSPDLDWGARDTLLNEDGNWGQWSGWSQCCNEGGSVVERTRFRLCDDPAPRASGAQCAGESTQLSGCPFDCPVDGSLTSLSSWGDCFCDGIAVGSGGVRRSSRTCDVAFGGKFCRGGLNRVSMCRNKCGTKDETSVDGELSEWSDWSDCFCDGAAIGSMGARMRNRTCVGTQNNGQFCSGFVDDYRPCDADCVPELD